MPSSRFKVEWLEGGNDMMKDILETVILILFIAKNRYRYDSEEIEVTEPVTAALGAGARSPGEPTNHVTNDSQTSEPGSVVLYSLIVAYGT